VLSLFSFERRKNMNKFVKGAFIFTGGVAGGFVLCGITTIKLVIKSNTFRTAIKDKISDEVSNFLYGEKQSRRVNYRSYTNVYGYRKEQRKQIDIVLETRKDAENVIDCVNNLFRNYGVVSFSDLCDLCGLPTGFENYKIGWTDTNSISKFHITRDQHGYRLIYPEPVVLK